MARRYRRRRRRGGKSIQRTAFKLIRLGALVAPAIETYRTAGGDPMQKLTRALSGYAGIGTGGKFYTQTLAKFWTPFIVTSLITYGIPKLTGIIRRL